MAPLDRVRLGIIGCGRISSLQVLGYLDHPCAEVVAVADRDEEGAARSAREWGARRSYTDYRRLCDDPEVNAVEILLPHHLHVEATRAALEAGKHVSLQKPPTFTIGELAELRDLARASGCRLRVSENFTYYPPHQKAAELVQQGAIGEPLSVRIKTAAGRFEDGWNVPAGAWEWRMDPQRCGGGPTCFDHGYHCFQMGRLFIAEPVERVHAWIHVNRFGPNAVYDGPALIGWRYANAPKFGSWEVVASLGMRVRSRYYASDDRIEIHGLEGILWINRCAGALLEEPSLVLYRDGETRAWHDLPTDWAESFRLVGREFVDALLDGRQPAQDADDAAETLRFAIAAHLAACEGRDVPLAEVGPETRARLPGAGDRDG
jgi:predicted dehydrogenase